MTLSEQLYNIISLYAADALLVIGLILLYICFIAKRITGAHSYHKACTSISIACLSLAISSAITAIFKVEYNYLDKVCWLFISSMQASLFLMASCLMLNTNCRIGQRVRTDLLSSAALFSLPIILSHYLQHNVLYWYFVVCLLLYLGLLVNYAVLFRREYKVALARIEEAYDDDLHLNLTWISGFFARALIIGLISFIAIASNLPLLRVAFIVSTPLFYLMAALGMIRYMSQVWIVSKTSVTKTMKLRPSNLSTSASIHSWIARKEYLRNDQTMDEIAATLGMTRYEFSSFFIDELGVQFRSWRIEMRIQEAIRILEQNPQVSIVELCDRCGYNDRNNFYKHFQRVKGTTLTDYRKMHPGELNK